MTSRAMAPGLKDVAAGGVLLLLSGLYYWQTRQIQQSSLSDEVGPEGLPLVLAAGLAVVAVAIAAKGALTLARARAVASATREEGESTASMPRALGFLALGVGYMVVAPFTGYAVGIALLVAAVGLYEGLRPDWRVAAVAMAMGTVFWLVFVKALGTTQPVGFLF